MYKFQWNELNPVVTHANYIKCEPGFQFGPRIIFEHQFVYIAKGKGVGDIQGRIHPVGEGDLFYYGPHIGHCFRADDNAPFEIVGMHFELNGSLADARKPPLKSEITSTYSNDEVKNLLIIGDRGFEELKITDHINVSGTGIPDLFLQMVTHFRNNNSFTAIINRGLLLHLLDMLHKHTHKMTVHLSPESKILYQVRTKLQQLAESPYSRRWINQWTGYNEDYISRKFRIEFGLSPHHFHLTQKIERAKSLLDYSDDSVTEISSKLHFNSIHYFCRVFKIHTGQSPSQYKKTGIGKRI